MKPDAHPVKHRTYWMNPRVKEKVKKEVDQMLEAGILFPMEELECINLIVIQNKKVSYDIRVCVYY